MRSSDDFMPLPPLHGGGFRQRRRRKEPSNIPSHNPRSMITFLSSVYIFLLHYYIRHVECGYIPAYSNRLFVYPPVRMPHGGDIAHDHRSYSFNERRVLRGDVVSRSFDIALHSSNDRNSENEQKENSADQILRNMGGFVPFFASLPTPTPTPTPPTPSPDPDKNDTSKNSGFWGAAGEWFRRDTEEKDNDPTSLKKRETKSKKKNPKGESTTSNRKKIMDASSPLSKLQDFVSFNSTKTPEDKENKKSIRSNNRGNSTSNNNNNPLSVFQKFFSTPSLFTKSPRTTLDETWYPVFPKTRIMPGEMVPVSVAGIDLLVIASIDGRSLYCIANSCPHLGTPLETGRLTRLPIEPSTPAESILTATSTVFTTTTTTDVAVLNNKITNPNDNIIFSETDIANILSQDGCEDCIICPLHRTAFALSSGEVRGEWCPYPPVIGALMGTVKEPTSAAVFQVRTRGKNIEVRLNSVLRESS